MKLHINKTPLTNNGAPGLRSILDTQHCFNLSRWSERNSQETGKVLEKVKKKPSPRNVIFFFGLFGADLTHKFDLYPSLKRRWQQSPCWWALRSGGERGLHSAGWRVAAVRGSGGGPGEAAGARVGPRTWTPGLRPSHRNGPAHRTGDRMREKSAKSPRYFFALNKYKYIYKKNKYTQACCVVRCCCCCWWRRARGEKNKNC